MFERIRRVDAGTERFRKIPKRDPNDAKLRFDERKPLGADSKQAKKSVTLETNQVKFLV